MIKKYSFFLCVALCSFSSIKSQNLLLNGDFESGGNGVGFNINSCCYNAIVPPFSGNTSPGNYAITSNPQPMNTAGFISGGDHTTGSGNMLIVDGTSTGGSQRFWRAGNNGGGACGLTVGTLYTFSYWIKSVATAVTGVSTQANIGVQCNNANTVTLVSGTVLAPLPGAGWQQVVYTFTPTNTCVNIEMWDNNTTATGNDFAVDDFSLTGPPPPFTLTYSAINSSCIGISDGAIVGYGTGGNPPYVFFLTGPITANNSNGIFTGLPAGTYSLKILEGADGEITINTIILSDPTPLTVNLPTTICIGSSSNLSASGSTTGYTWTSSPSDPTLITPNISNPIVSPTQTTTYTVTSSTSSTINLIYNGDFNRGNTGFLTDYVYYTPNNPTGIQKAYGIVTNTNNWESGFSSCQDHTSGTGAMMVIDGSLFNSGNDKVWCQTVAVTPNQNYTFSYWIQTVATPNQANIDVFINGSIVGTALAPATVCGWVQQTYSWNSGSGTSAQICMYDRTTDLAGNDFAFDDISFVGPATTCLLSKSVTITVDSVTVPNFPTTLNLCTGATPPTLATVSPNSISGTWSPSVINSITSGTYTFTPAINQCATTTSLAVAVNTPIIPTFTTANAICFGVDLSPLPTTSLNTISGTWSPALNNTATTTYTFTPAANQCATTTTLEIVVNPANITPEFGFGPTMTVCYGNEPQGAFPTVSENGISGTWNPNVIDPFIIGTTIYSFTPNPINTCASIVTVAVTISENTAFTVNSGCDGTDFTLRIDQNETQATSVTWYNAQDEIIGASASIIITEKGDYRVIVEKNGCSSQQVIQVPSVYCKIPRGLSPNTDAYNATFELTNLNVKNLQIFNRYGTEVYSKSNYKNEWDGKTNVGKELPDGTYYYVIHFETGKSKTGWVYLNKEN